ncbi:hypothetical protein P175DRAFT_0505464 [Aspergillus ochraceoroseus IBT 24754]|uniref:O-methyltransferase C-terminal domain-containing protein n=1 Tax=Aspergillus ochraceoroseus IBT 24754 TaxID=1392256 RepID=A0A2T5LKJ8_9EURO|nr:uncharacterized protein P175DRAFT_0505464 [Aspergillus ochraceoroseus IBT 24754]PTU16806.1 hypothetical protein P175DRAFT_0505464 [Aspergillus ochraceoroseus IBT 24754]
MVQADLLEYAKDIQARLADITCCLEKQEIHTVRKEGYPTGPGYEELTSARLSLLETANDLQYLAMGPTEWLKMTLAVNKHDHLCYYMIDQFNIHQSVPLNGEISYEELSAACGLPVDPYAVSSAMPCSITLFREPNPGYVAHSDASSVFVTDAKMAAWLGHNYDEVFRCLHAVPDAIRNHPTSADPGHTPCGVVFNQPKGFFAGLLQDQPWRASRFEHHDASHIVRGYDWGQYGNGLVVDRIGPPPGCRRTMQFQVHDFFHPNPQTTADVYLLRHIIHDWGDDYASKILWNIASVMKPTARIIVVDIVIPEPGTLPWQAHRMIRSMDLQMMRTKQDWRKLLANSNSKLNILSISQPPYSVASIIEIGLVH